MFNNYLLSLFLPWHQIKIRNGLVKIWHLDLYHTGAHWPHFPAKVYNRPHKLPWGHGPTEFLWVRLSNLEDPRHEAQPFRRQQLFRPEKNKKMKNSKIWNCNTIGMLCNVVKLSTMYFALCTNIKLILAGRYRLHTLHKYITPRKQLHCCIIITR